MGRVQRIAAATAVVAAALPAAATHAPAVGSSATVSLLTHAADAPLTPTAGGIDPRISADGRYVVYQERPDPWPLVRLDRETGEETVVSISAGGAAAGASSPDVSHDGSVVAFDSNTGLVPGDTNGTRDVYLRDLDAATTTLVSATPTGDAGAGKSLDPHTSDDGRFVVFTSLATDLVPGDANGDRADVYLRDTVAGTTELISRTPSGAQMWSASQGDISADGSVVVYTGRPVDKAPLQAYVLWRATGEVEAIPFDTAEEIGPSVLALAGDGSAVSFVSRQDVSTPSTSDDRDRVHRYDLVRDELTTLWTAGTDDDRADRLAVSHDGRTTIIGLGEHLGADVSLLRAEVGHPVERVDVRPDGGEPDTGPYLGPFEDYAFGVSADGGLVVFASEATDLLPLDTTPTDPQVYLADRGGPAPVTCAEGSGADHSPWPFTDVDATHPFCADIWWLAMEGLTSGYADGGYHPTAAVSRQAIAAVLHRYSGDTSFVAPMTPTFPDVPTSNLDLYTGIEWLVAEGLASGYADGGYHPTAPVSRQAIAALLHRYSGDTAFVPPVAPTFPDVPTTSPFFADVEWLVAEGLANGYADGGYHPTAPVSRQAIAALLHRYDRRVADGPRIDNPDVSPLEVGVPVHHDFRGVGGHKPYSWSVTGPLPDGIVWDPIAAILSGTPTTPDSDGLLLVTLTDASGSTAEATIDVSVRRREHTLISFGGDALHLRMSADGTRLAFDAPDGPMAPDDTNGVRDVFLHDTTTGTTTLISRDSGGAPAGGQMLDLSDDGTTIAFRGDASLVAGEPAAAGALLLHDVGTATTSIAGHEGGGSPYLAWDAVLSANGGVVAFESGEQLVGRDDNTASDVYRLVVSSGDLRIVSRQPDGSVASAGSARPSISDDGTRIAFVTAGTDVLVRRVGAGTTTLLWDGGAAGRPSISGDGTKVGFAWQTLTWGGFPPSIFGSYHTVVHVVDVTGAVQHTYLDSTYAFSGKLVVPTAPPLPAISLGLTGDLVAIESPGNPTVISRQDDAGGYVLASESLGGGAPDDDCTSPVISADGSRIAFLSWADDLVGIPTDGDVVLWSAP